MGDLRQLGNGRLLVNKLFSVQVTKLTAVEPHSEVRAKHPLPFLGNRQVSVTFTMYFISYL